MLIVLEIGGTVPNIFIVHGRRFKCLVGLGLGLVAYGVLRLV